MEGWDSYLVGNLGAAAALLGLLFVGVSINLKQILEDAGLPVRAIETLAMFVAIVLTSSLLLMPDQPDWLAGLWMVLTGIALFEISLISARANRATLPAGLERAFLIRVGLSWVTSVLLVAGGVVVAVGEPDGMYVYAAGITFAYLVALANAWVLLVEINR